jgi:hypothetical protein
MYRNERRRELVRSNSSQLRCVRELASPVVSVPSEAEGRIIAPVPSLPVLCVKANSRETWLVHMLK